MEQQYKIKEIDFHIKLNELQAKIEDYEVLDIEEYIIENRIKTYCKECSKEKFYNKDFCEECNKLKFEKKIGYGIFTSGWITASIVSSFFFSSTTVLSVGLSTGTLLNLTYNLFK